VSSAPRCRMPASGCRSSSAPTRSRRFSIGCPPYGARPAPRRRTRCERATSSHGKPRCGPKRPAKLEAPTDYRQGATTLVIRDEADKNRFGRELPLSEAACVALDSVCSKSGPTFGRHDCIMLLRRAAGGHRRLPRDADLGLRFSPLGRDAPRTFEQQPSGHHVPARPQAASHDGPLHATSEGRRRRGLEGRRRLPPDPEFWPNTGRAMRRAAQR
jgi:hypothetical protein